MEFMQVVGTLITLFILMVIVGFVVTASGGYKNHDDGQR